MLDDFSIQISPWPHMHSFLLNKPIWQFFILFIEHVSIPTCIQDISLPFLAHYHFLTQSQFFWGQQSLLFLALLRFGTLKIDIKSYFPNIS